MKQTTELLERVIDVKRVLRGGKVGFEVSSEGVTARGKDMNEAMANLRFALIALTQPLHSEDSPL